MAALIVAVSLDACGGGGDDGGAGHPPPTPTARRSATAVAYRLDELLEAAGVLPSVSGVVNRTKSPVEYTSSGASRGSARRSAGLEPPSMITRSGVSTLICEIPSLTVLELALENGAGNRLRRIDLAPARNGPATTRDVRCQVAACIARPHQPVPRKHGAFCGSCTRRDRVPTDALRPAQRAEILQCTPGI